MIVRAPGFESGSPAARLAALGVTLPKAAVPLAAAGAADPRCLHSAYMRSKKLAICF